MLMHEMDETKSRSGALSAQPPASPKTQCIQPFHKQTPQPALEPLQHIPNTVYLPYPSYVACISNQLLSCGCIWNVVACL